LQEHARDHADAPFFQYLAFTSPHFPLQAPAEDIARYADRYSDGWDVIRNQRWDRQKALGILDCALSARDSKTIPKWNLSEAELRERIGPGEAGHAVAWTDLTPEQKGFQASKMAIHAAMIDRMDQEIGRVLNQIEAMGALDNTLVVFASDNGASAEQIIRGDGHDPAAAPGSAQSFLCLGPGWSTASNTPFRLHKSWVHEGGISTPLIVSWPKGITARGELRRDVGHVIDLVPTVLDLTGAHPSADWRGQTPPPLPGRSLVPAFTQDGSVKRDFLYFSHIGNRASRIGDWKLVSAKEFDNDWELYDLASDRAEMVNLAAKHPDRVREMAARWTESDKLFHRQSESDAPEHPKPPASRTP
jgi:arylsulfatase